MLTIGQYAELIAFKARLHDADEATLLGFERALVEIIYWVQRDTLQSLLSAVQYAAPTTTISLEQFRDHIGAAELTVGDNHKHDAREARLTLIGHLIDNDKPLDRDIWPRPDSKLDQALKLRKVGGYKQRRNNWRRKGAARMENV